jgi:hypothetical protein
MVRRSGIVALTLFLSVMAVSHGLADQKAPLALKPGLWKIVSEIQMSPGARDRLARSPIPLPPGIVADMEKPSEKLQCLTQEDIAANRLTPTPPPEQQRRMAEMEKCRVKINRSSATEVQLTETCFDKGTRTDRITKIKIEAPTPTTLNYTMRPWDPDEGPTLTRRGTWLAESCTEVQKER